MASYVPPIKNGASGWIGYVSLAPRTPNGAWQSNPTLAAGDVKVSLDGGSLANLNTLPAVAPASSKLVKITLNQAETNADNITIVFSDAAGAEWCDLTIPLQTVARQIDDLASQASVDLVKTKTDNLPSDPADASVIAGRFDTVDVAIADLPTNAELATALTAADDAVLAAISGGSGLDAAGVRAALGMSSANLDTQLSTIDTVVDAVKVKTDSLAFTVSGSVDANIQHVNDEVITGTGASGDEWRPT